MPAAIQAGAQMSYAPVLSDKFTFQLIFNL